MKSLVGYTGFVGSNIAKKEKFDGLYDSKNVQQAYGTKAELLVYSGVPAQKFIANQFPKKDFQVIENAIQNIKRIKPKKIVLISTIDVYKNPVDVDEDTVIDIENLQDYGKNRYYLEQWVKENFEDYLIVHLPGLYGDNIKKNFIYDLIHIIPSMLKKEKFEQLVERNDFIVPYYTLQENGFYQCISDLSKEENKRLKEYFNTIGFSALNFTDSRASYQFYNLEYLWEHIQIALNHNIKILNLAVEPVTASEIYQYITKRKFVNEISNQVVNYNFKTKYANLFNGKDGYLFNKAFVLEDIKKFIETQGEK